MKYKYRIKRLLAYFYMPLIFVILGYGTVYLAARPFLELGKDIGSMFMETSQHQEDIRTSIYLRPDTNGDQPATIPLSEVTWPSYGQQYGELNCDAAGLNASVTFGDNNKILRTGVGQFNGSYIPGYGKIILLCAHNTTFFAPLEQIKRGDIVTFTTSYGVYEYKITKTKVLDHNDKSAFDLMQEKEQLVMYTCYPFERLVGTKTDRLFVYGDKISGPELIP